LEADLQINIKGLPEERAYDIGHAVIATIRALEEVHKDLDLRRMHRMIFTTDFAGELAELSRARASGNPITHTDEEYLIAVGKVIILPRGEEGYEILPVMNAYMAATLAPEDPNNYDTEALRTVLHFLHHELCHVHDDNKKIDAFSSLILKTCYSGKDIFIRPLAEVCWCEYIATVLSSSSAGEGDVAVMAKNLADAIKRTKPVIDSEILAYRYHGDLDRLLGMFARHGESLAKIAAYMLGYVDGLRVELCKLSTQTAECLSGSYFERTWDRMQEALRDMRLQYPDGWADPSIYDALAVALEGYYAEMGFLLSTVEDGGIYVTVPFRPETTPQ
jgi:hypothetical protein